MIKKLKFNNKSFTKSIIKKLIYNSFCQYGKTRTSFLINSLKDLGFYYSTKSGISLSIEDLQVPSEKNPLLLKGLDSVVSIEMAYKQGSLDSIEKSLNLIKNWSITTYLVTQSLVSYLQKFDPFNSLHLMVFSGARGNISQITQLMGMRGLMSDPTGHLLEIPIMHNFREGLTIFEYLLSTYGARKGLVDTALKTADAGFFTRRLVTAVNDVLIGDYDCLTNNFLKIYKFKSKPNFIKQLIGRTCVDSIYDSIKQTIIIYKNTCITESIANNLYNLATIYIRVYSVLTCKLNNSICKKCYGWNISSNKLVELGSSVGVISAHSIGEPATQLTMRTFHTGGSFTSSSSRKIFSQTSGVIFYNMPYSLTTFRTEYGNLAKHVVTSFFLNFITYKNIKNVFFLRTGTVVYVLNTQFIVNQTLIAEIFVKVNSHEVYSLKTLFAPHSGELFIIPEINLISLLQGTVYDFSKSSFLNTFLELKKYKKSYFLFYFKIYSLISGFISYSFNLENLSNIKIIKNVQIVLFPLFWDNVLKKIIFLGEYKTYYILMKIPLFNKVNKILFAKQKTLLYDTPQKGFLRCKKSIVSFKKLTSNFIFLYSSFYFKQPKLFSTQLTQKLFKIFSSTYRDDYSSFQFSFCRSLLFKNFSVIYINKKAFSPFCSLSAFSNKLYFPGELLFNKIKILFLTTINILKYKGVIFIYFIPIIAINVNKNKRFIKRIDINLAIQQTQTFKFKLSKNKNLFIYNGKSHLFIHIILDIKTKYKSLYSLKVYNSAKFTYLLFMQYFINFINTIFILESPLHSNSYQYNLQINHFEYTLKKTLLSFISCQFTNLGNYLRIKKRYNEFPRILVLTNQDFFTFYFESIKRIKRLSCFIYVNSFLSPFLRLPKSGKISFFGPFLTSVHLGTPFFLSKNIQLFHSSKNYLKQGEIFGVISFNQFLTGDIVQGLPRLDELLELRIFYNSEKYVVNSGLSVTSHKNMTNCLKIKVIQHHFNNHHKILCSNKIYKKTIKPNILKQNPILFAGTLLNKGEINFKYILKYLFIYFLRSQSLYRATDSSFHQIQILLIKKINVVYTKQQIGVSTKHFEVLVRQLTSYIRVIYDLSNTFLVGEILKFSTIININTAFRINSKCSIYYTPLIMGITKISLATDGFLSAVSFQRTTKLLAFAAVEGKIDYLAGIKEALMLGQTPHYHKCF